MFLIFLEEMGHILYVLNPLCSYFLPFMFLKLYVLIKKTVYHINQKIPPKNYLANQVLSKFFIRNNFLDFFVSKAYNAPLKIIFSFQNCFSPLTQYQIHQKLQVDIFLVFKMSYITIRKMAIHHWIVISSSGCYAYCSVSNSMEITAD